MCAFVGVRYTIVSQCSVRRTKSNTDYNNR